MPQLRTSTSPLHARPLVTFPSLLASRTLGRVELRSAPQKAAFLLLPYNYYYYEDVGPTAKLLDQLPSEEGGPCCTGATSSSSSGWLTRLWLSPLATDDLLEGKEPDLDAFNRWATDARIRTDLRALVTRGVKLSGSATIDVAIPGGSRGPNANVTVVDEPIWKESVRRRKFVFQFSRKSCGDCTGGMSGWWLRKLDVLQACKAGMGHEEYATDPC